MSTDALVLDHPGQSDLLTPEFRELDRLQLPPGRSYVVFAKGHVSVRVTHVTFRLEAFDSTDETMYSYFSGASGFEDGHATFSLSVATTLNDDPDLFVVATLSAACSQGLATVSNVKLVALTVDNLAITTA
jgi:hypothetical protein